MNPGTANYQYKYNDFQVKDFEKVFCEETEHSSEWQDELGLNMYDFEARMYDPATGRTTTHDPLADTFAHQSPYSFFNSNPIYFKDPTGMASESTHIDKDGNVLAVFDDGDTGVYQHGDNADGSSPTEYQLSKRAEKEGTSSGGAKIGETKHWDEFVSPETGKAMTEYRIQVGKSFDPIIDKLAKEAGGMGLIDIAKESGPGGKFDVKNDYKNIGGLLNGKYATSRSAGNYLAGYNANNGVINFTTFQKLAGALHVKGSLSNAEKAKIVITGKAYGPAPAYGEVMYQYRMSAQGWSDKGRSGGEVKPLPINTGLKW